MRWRTKEKPLPWDARVRRRFLWVPRRNPRDYTDVRWLEGVDVGQVYHPLGGWVDVGWGEDDAELLMDLAERGVIREHFEI